MRILFDTNVILDVLLDREPFSRAAAQLFSLVEAGMITGYVCTTAVTTVHYLARKAIGNKPAVQKINKLMKLFEIAPVNRAVLEAAIAAEFKDFEDAVVYALALYKDTQGIVTRDFNDFKRSKINVFSPEELLLMLESKRTSGS